MNKHYLYLIPIFAFMLSIPNITRAALPPPLVEREIQDQLRNNFQNRVEKARDNQQVRNDLLRVRQDDATNTKPIIKDIRRDGREDIKNASSSEDRKEIRQNMRTEIFKLQLGKITKELNKALENLKQIRARIFSRIQKAEQSGRDMTEAKNLLTIADNKIAIAQHTIDLLASSSPSMFTTASSTASSTASTTIDLGKPRIAADSAKKAIKDAKDALNDVVRAIAHAMGFKFGRDDNSHASTTATSTATTTP